MSVMRGSVVGVMIAALVNYCLPELLKVGASSTPNTQRQEAYNFIIVGAGSAGSVLGSRLSEVKQWKVLLLEAGGDETPYSETPLNFWFLANTSLDWHYQTVRQKRFCKNEDGICHYARGKVLGGTSSVNGMVYVRGNKEDYDGWERMGLKDWGYDNVLPYFKKAENTKERDLRESPYHGQDGPLSVQYSRYIPRISEDFILAGEELGLKRRDYNGPSQTSIAFTQMTVDGAKRCSASTAYLTPVKERKNLFILKNTKVTKVVIDAATKTATGVEYIENGSKKFAWAKKEVILSAGVFNSPQLLMLSGVGPKKHLREMNIPVIQDLPVGRNLVDHTGATLTFTVNGNVTITPDQYNSKESLLEYTQNKNGPLTSNGIPVMAFINLGKDLTAEPADLQIYMNVLQLDSQPQDVHLVSVLSSLLRPRSTGTVRLRSNSPLDPPLIDPNYFADRQDLDETLAGLKFAIKLMMTSAMEKYSPAVFHEAEPSCSQLYNNQTAYFECITLYSTLKVFHASGTAKMGNQTDPTAVLGADLCVRGINRLRVVDASVFPSMVSGNPNGPVIMVAEKAADIIKHHYLI